MKKKLMLQDISLEVLLQLYLLVMILSQKLHMVRLHIISENDSSLSLAFRTEARDMTYDDVDNPEVSFDIMG